MSVGLMTTSASVIAPVAGSEKTRVRPGVSPLTKARFSGVSAMVMRLTRSPPPEGLTDCAPDCVSTNWTFAANDQRCNARRTMPATSVPGLMFGPGLESEVEKATVIVFVGQRRAIELLVY